jgi:AraC-like DNA-binding protein
MPSFRSSKIITADELAADLAEVTGARGLAIDGPDDGFLCETEAIHEGGVVVLKQKLEAGLQVGCSSESDTYTFFFNLEGSTAFEFPRYDAHLHAGQGYIRNNQRPYVIRTSAHGTRMVIGIERAVMRRVLAEQFGKTSKVDLLFAAEFDSAAGSGKVAHQLANALLSFDGSSNERTQRRLLDALLLQIIEGFPHNHDQLLSDNGPSLVPRQVKRAQDLMEEFALENLSIIELAERMNVSARALQYSFIRYCGMTPVSYYRLVRLRRAVAELAMLGDSPLRDVAVKWGFTNVGRFSALCQKEYGRRPHEFRA